MDNIQEELILSGTWLYDGIVKNEVHIIKTNYKFGSGDYEDEPEFREDQFGTFYGVHFGSYDSKNKEFLVSNYSSISEAKEYADRVCPGLEWNEQK